MAWNSSWVSKSGTRAGVAVFAVLTGVLGPAWPGSWASLQASGIALANEPAPGTGNWQRCGTSAWPMDPELRARTHCTAHSTSIQPQYQPRTVYEIPVVVHVISDSQGNGELTDEDIRGQLAVLNEDYRALAGSLGEGGNDARIQFALARHDPSGNPTTGIMRYRNDAWFTDQPDPDMGAMHAALNWDTNRYLNIYTNQPAGDVLGYAYYPQQSAGTPNDGVVLLWRVVGRNGPIKPYDRGRTATHEIGHYLGLFHTFASNDCGDPDEPYSTGDLLADTTPEAKPSYGCTSTPTACPGVKGQNPIHNYMNYSDDSCMWEFTPEQINRMRCVLLSYRPELFNHVPEAVFRTTVTSPLTASFTDASFDTDGSIVTWAWDFGDGHTATDPSPVHTYQEQGRFAVTLTVTDDRGATHTTAAELDLEPSGCACRLGRAQPVPWSAVLLACLALAGIRRRGI